MPKLIGATKSLYALLTFTEIFALLSAPIMLKNEAIRQKYSFFRKGLNYFEAECITSGPSPGFSSRGGPKTRKGGHIFKIQ